MIDLLATRHAQERIRQRGYRDLDVNLLVRLAEPCGDDAYYLSNRVLDREIE